MSLNVSTTAKPPQAASANMKSLELWQLLTLDNPVFCCFVFWTSILVLKMIFMSFLTAIQRFRNKVFANQEDLIFKNIEVQFDDPHVERVRRAHRNDMENILPYFTMALIYICTNPDPNVACNLFRIAAISRLVHTFVYAIYPVPQPARFLSFFIALVTTVYMAIMVAIETMHHI